MPNPQQEQEVSYFQQRMDLLGITPEINTVNLWFNELKDGTHQPALKAVPVFAEVPEGIEIKVWDLDRQQIIVQRGESRFKRPFTMIRLKDPVVKDGRVTKYRIPKGTGTYPFFPPSLVDKFEKKVPIPTLFLVEGYFKAFKASMAGADIVGLSSITHMKDKEKKGLHPDIKRIIDACSVQRIVWLTDGDALDITSGEITPDTDLYKRPSQFFASVTTFKSLLSDYTELEKWFMHIDIDQIRDRFPKFTRDQLKGIDDLLITMPDRQHEIVQDMITTSRAGEYFQKFNISFGISKVYSHFRIGDPKIFYLYHVERRPELQGKQWRFNGTRYQYDEESGECKIVIPNEARFYFRCGDDYYKHVEMPNQYGNLERRFLGRSKTTITDDHGKNILKHIPKYEAFCNIPSHTNFQQVIHACYNVYSPLDYAPDDEICTESECPTIISFVRHIFGDKPATFIEKLETGEKKEHKYSSFDLGMDYLQLLYHYPQQKLPILCLVSKENNTGKSTFGNFLRMMLGANVAIVGNADLKDNFNAHWATKNVVVCDEAKIDKQEVMEKVKMLSTARKIMMNAKGKAHVELDCFLKFIFITNNEENFISASEDDVRYWVIKVRTLQQDNPHILEQFSEEMSAFLSYLNNRKMKTDLRGRMWFHPQLLRTDALKKVIEHSRPAVEREIRHYMRTMFLDTGYEEIMMSVSDVRSEVFKNSAKYDLPYISLVLKEKIRVDQVHYWSVDGVQNRYSTEEEALAAAGVKFPDITGFLLQSKISKKYIVKRYSFPRIEERFNDGKTERLQIDVSANGRPFVFPRHMFVTDEEMKQLEYSPEQQFNASMQSSSRAPMDDSDGF